MSRLIARIAGLLRSRTMVGTDKAGNRYFARNDVIDGVTKEKRWVIFKEEEDPTSIPVEWICWLNGQRKRAPTPEEMDEMEARRKIVRQNVERLKKEEEERRGIQGSALHHKTSGKIGGPDLQSFLRQVQSDGGPAEEASERAESKSGIEVEKEKTTESQENPVPQTTEPKGSGSSFQPGVWQPPS